MPEVVVISGVAGMTGSFVARRLLDRGCEVIGFDNYFAGSTEEVVLLSHYGNFHFFPYDLNDATQMNELFKFSIARSEAFRTSLSFVNCAAVVHTKHFYKPEDTFLTNVMGMRDSLYRAIEGGFSKYINCSTSEVYSMNSWIVGGVRENSPILLATAEQSLRCSYATGKLLTEHFLRECVNNARIKGCSIRFANVYSPTEAHDEHIIPYIISSLMKTKSVVLLENAKQTYRTFLHNSDSCDAVINLLDCEKALDGSVYNVGTSEEIAIIELVARLAKLLDLKDYSLQFSGRRTADPPRRLLNIDKIEKTVGWTPKIMLDIGLRQCVDHRMKRVY